MSYLKDAYDPNHGQFCDKQTAKSGLVFERNVALQCPVCNEKQFVQHTELTQGYNVILCRQCNSRFVIEINLFPRISTYTIQQHIMKEQKEP